MSRSSLSPLGTLIAEIRDERMALGVPRAGRSGPEVDLRIETGVVSGPSVTGLAARSWRWPVSLAVHGTLLVGLAAASLLRSPGEPPPSPRVSLAAAVPAAAADPATPPATTTPPKSPVKPMRLSADMQKPARLKHVNPVYPRAAVAAKVHGTVTLECVVSPQGRVTGIKVVRGVPLLDAAAVDAVRQWVFAPTVRQGVPVPVILTVAVQFGDEGRPTRSETLASAM